MYNVLVTKLRDNHSDINNGVVKLNGFASSEGYLNLPV